jgi:hypothetical protein
MRAPPNENGDALAGAAAEIRVEQTKDNLALGRIQSWAELEGLTEQLEVIAAWRSDLQSRIAIARLRFELVDIDHDLTGLDAEAAQFCRACRALMWGVPA